MGPAPGGTSRSARSEKGWSYEDARANWFAVLGLHACEDTLPAKYLGAAVIEETFALLNESVLGRGLGEEAITSSFITALIASARMFAPWGAAAGPGIAWVQSFSKVDESLTGADFALVLCNEDGYRIVIVQAKRIKDGQETSCSVKRPSSATDLVADADDTLSKLLAGAQDLELAGKHWQLSRLLSMQNNMKTKHVQTVYALWPDDHSLPLCRPLDEEARKELARKDKAGAPKQILELGAAVDFRKWLIDWSASSGARGLTTAQASAELKQVLDVCSNLLILDVSTTQLGLALKAELGWVESPPLPATSYGSSSLTCG